MSSYRAPLKDLRFALNDVLNVAPLFARLGFADATPDLVDAVLEEAGRFTTTVLAPLNRVGDEIGCTLDTATGEVTTPPGFKQAFRQFAEGGWQGLQHPVDFGGQGLPKTIGAACGEILNSANMSFALCPLLTDGAIEALITAGSDEPYYTNSTQLPVGSTDDIFQALQHQDSLQTMYTGGTVFHGFLGERIEDWRGARLLVRRIAENFERLGLRGRIAGGDAPRRLRATRGPRAAHRPCSSSARL